MTADEIVERCNVIGRELADLCGMMSDLSHERRALVRELHDEHGWSYRRIAPALGMTTARVGQIMARLPLRLRDHFL